MKKRKLDLQNLYCLLSIRVRPRVCNHLLAEKNLGRSLDLCVDWYFSCEATLIFDLWITSNIVK